jgi:hypothetical protein
MVSGSIDQLAFAVPASMALLVAATLSVRRRAIEILLGCGFVALAMLARAGSLEPTVLAVVVAGAGGGVAWLIYRSQVRDRLWIVAPTMLCLAVIGALASLVHSGYPGSRVGGVMAIVAVLVGYRLWRWLVLGDRASA